MFNVTVLVILVLSSIANYFREKRESDLKTNENARKARAEQDMQRNINNSNVQFSEAKLYNIL